jgi:hypothetical protein
MARTANAVQRALETPQHVTHLGMGQAKVDRVASSRRILGSDGKVKYARMSTTTDPKARAAPEGVIDPMLRTLSLWADDRPVVCLSYYACHPTCNYGQGVISAEFAGVARANRERALPGAAQIWFTGAGGNIAVSKYNDGSKENRQIFARRLTEAMRKAWEATTRVPICADDVTWRVRPVSLPPRKSLDEDKLREKLANTKLKRQARIFAARDLAWLHRLRAGHRIDLTCLQLGPAYVLHMPGELFVEYQLAAQAVRPNAMVCMAAYGDLGPGYICTKIAYSQGGYESGPVSRVAPSVEGVLMEAIRELLK